jgi:hypothetical protein
MVISASEKLNSIRYNDYAEDATYEYFGFSNAGGEWVIKRLHKTTMEMRMANGFVKYADAWVNYATQVYGY